MAFSQAAKKGSLMNIYKDRLKATRFTAAAIIIASSMLAQSALATENGGSSYGHGSEGFLDAFPPGLHLVNYTNYYEAGRTLDNSGKETAPGFKTRATANIFRVMHTSKDLEILGSKVSSHILVPIVDVYVNTATPAGSDSRTGLGDITIAPVMLGWHTKNWHLITGVDITTPTGTYDKTRIANIGRNYWDIQPNFITAYTGDEGFQAFGKFMYDFNTKNTDTGYLSGQEFHVDYGLSQRVTLFSTDFQIGVGGYIYQQTTKDKVDSGYMGPLYAQGRVFAAGPQIEYQYKNMSFDLKFQKEFEARNRTEGSKLWLKFNYSF